MQPAWQRNIDYPMWAVAVAYSVAASKLSETVRRRRTVFSAVTNLLLLVAGLVLFWGVSGSYHIWSNNHQARLQATRAVAVANHTAAQTKSKPRALPPHSAPSTIQPASSSLASYQVAPEHPRYLIIPKLGIDARVMTVGLLPDNSIATPASIFDAAWYDGSALPGRPGAALVDGHNAGLDTTGIFFRLDKLSPGDTIKIELGNGSIVSYGVVKTAVYNTGDINMANVLSPIKAGQSGLNVISCYGKYVNYSEGFNKRIVVFATQI